MAKRPESNVATVHELMENVLATDYEKSPVAEKFSKDVLKTMFDCLMEYVAYSTDLERELMYEKSDSNERRKRENFLAKQVQDAANVLAKQYNPSSS